MHNTHPQRALNLSVQWVPYTVTILSSNIIVNRKANTLNSRNLHAWLCLELRHLVVCIYSDRAIRLVTERKIRIGWIDVLCDKNSLLTVFSTVCSSKLGPKIAPSGDVNSSSPQKPPSIAPSKTSSPTSSCFQPEHTIETVVELLVLWQSVTITLIKPATWLDHTLTCASIYHRPSSALGMTSCAILCFQTWLYSL